MNNELFRLTANSFHILKANYESNHTDISELVDDAEFDGLFEVEEIHRAQQSLVTPKSRLIEELSWLPELSDAQVVEIISLLKSSNPSAVTEAIVHLPELAKANISAHLCGVQSADQKLIQSLAAFWHEVDPTHLLGFINDAREKSSFPSVDDQQLRHVLKEIEEKHSNVAAASIWKSTAPGALMDKIVEVELAKNPSGAFLERLVRSYDIRSETDLVRISDNINDHIERAKPNGADVSEHVGAISDLLDAWDEINQPVQVFEQHQGHEEGRSKRIYENARTLSLDLANNHGNYGESLRLAEALLRTFPELESVAEVLRNDVEQLEALDEQQQQEQHVKPLIAACEAAKLKIPKLKSSLEVNGFTASGTGPLAEVLTTFTAAISMMAETSSAYLTVRDLALYINNDRDDPETAYRLVDGLLEFTGADPSEDIRLASQ